MIQLDNLDSLISGHFWPNIHGKQTRVSDFGSDDSEYVSTSKPTTVVCY